MGSLRTIRSEPSRQARLDEDIFFAIWRNNVEEVASLLDQGASVTTTNEFGDLPPASAANFEHLDIVRLLVERGADVNAVDERGNTALMFAAMPEEFFEEHSPVDLLIEFGADVNVQDKIGYTALMYAIGAGEINSIRSLVKAGTNVSAVNERCETAVSLAYRNLSESYLQEFLELSSK